MIDRAKKLNIPVYVFNNEFEIEKNGDQILNEINPDLIILAGFILKFPEFLVSRFQNKIINIHPALLPKFGGKRNVWHECA